MNIKELHKKFGELVKAGHGKQILWDDDNPTFQITGIIEKDELDSNGDMLKKFYFEVDEVPK